MKANVIMSPSSPQSNCFFREDVDVYILITSVDEPKSSHLRGAIRQTWINQTDTNPTLSRETSIKHVFVLGSNTKGLLSTSLIQEATVHKDILVFDSIDSYRNLTLKTILAFQWVAEICPSAGFLLKTDDDIYLNLHQWKHLLEIKNDQMVPSGKIHGYCFSAVAAIRNSASKWSLDKETYPFSSFPPFCVGPAYMLSMQTALGVVRVAPHVPYIALEDVFVGLCAVGLGYGIDDILKNRNWCLILDSSKFCTFHKKNPCPFYHNVTPSTMTELLINCT